jgi:hypothetical protein
MLISQIGRAHIVVENSRYSLVEAVGLTEQVLDMEPDEEGIFSFTGDMFDTTDIAKTERTASYYGLELGFEAVESLIKYIPVVSQAIDVSSLIFNLVTLHRSASKILDLDEKLEKELETLTFEEMLENKEKYMRLFIEGVKDVEEIQASMYDDFGDLFQTLFSIIPYEEALAGLTGGAGYASKIIDTLLDVGFGVAAEKAVRAFVESYEFTYDEKSELDDIVMEERRFEDWLRRNEDSTTTGMKMILVTLRILQGPFPALLNPSSSLIRSFRALFVGAKIQNKLMKIIKQLKDPEFLAPDAVASRERSEDNVAAGEEREYSDRNIAQDTSPDSGSSQFLRKLFFTDPGDERMFAESLENKKLGYLLSDEEEEDEDVNEFSAAGAIAIGTLPLGTSTKGPKGKHSSTSGGKAFPYSKKSREDFKNYSRKTFGGTK